MASPSAAAAESTVLIARGNAYMPAPPSAKVVVRRPVYGKVGHVAVKRVSDTAWGWLRGLG